MRAKENPLLPSVYEYWYLGLATLAVLLAGNAKVLLQHFGLVNSSGVVGEQVSDTVGSGLRALDAFNATPGVVTFITWGVIGLILFSLVQTFVRASGYIEFEREVGSSRFVHPANFSRRRYWRTILLHAFLSFGLIILFLTYLALYVLFIVPVASLYLQRVLIVSDPSRLLDLTLSIFVMAAGTFVLYFILKAVLWQHHISQR
jgi:hypothetical protein